VQAKYHTALKEIEMMNEQLSDLQSQYIRAQQNEKDFL
jgi:hypothetical protein